LQTGRTLFIAASLALGVVLAMASTPVQAAWRGTSAVGTAYYLDCAAGNDGAAGTSPATAWKTLAKVGTVVFQPGDSILINRGTTCNGVLQPQGSGAADAPITIGAYGNGVRPMINGGGARAAVYLYNVQYWAIHDLEVTDPGPADGTPRTGIYVLLSDYGTGHGYVVENVNVHDVPGCDCLQGNLENSGGILFKAAGSTTPTGFDGIQVTRNTVSGIDNMGIGTVSQWTKRALFPAGTNSYVPMTHVHISYNKVSNDGGDGIEVSNGLNSLEDFNEVDGFGLRATASHAGVLAYNSDYPVVEHNTVTGGSNNPPSFAYSADAADSNQTIQYNYSHDNNGPFMLFCAPNGAYSDGATVRYNISNNDHSLMLGTFIIPVVANGCGNPVTNATFYNNVVYSTVAPVLFGSEPNTPITVSNNIFYGQAGGSAIQDTVSTFSHNLYFNVNTAPPSDQQVVNGNPSFVNPTQGPGGFMLNCGSPVVGAGAAIANDGGRDFFGLPIPTPPNVGAYQGNCLS
jgi:hypothetical protein